MKLRKVEAHCYFSYWGKYKRGESPDYHLLPYHCLDVAATAEALLKSNKPFTRDVAEFLQLTNEQFVRLFCFFIALHDLGKFSSAFQDLLPDPIEQLFVPNSLKRYDGAEYRHDRLGYFFWRKNKEKIIEKITSSTSNLEKRMLSQAADGLFILMESMLGHHGKPINKDAPANLAPFMEGDNEKAAASFIQDVLILFAPSMSIDLLIDKEWQNRLKQISWHSAGLAVLADWLGSNNQYFTYCTEHMALEQYWGLARKKAQHALANTELWQPLKIQPFLSVKEHYGFEPTSLQHWAESVSIDSSPQLFILEDITGAGKTEAALVLAHRLMEAGAANGFYFGLPTMATSNAMFSRVAGHYSQMLTQEQGGKPSIVLAHGAREMNQQFQEAVLAANSFDNNYSNTDNTATAQCNFWLADSRKKALLAPVGVGTIDQALLAVLPRRHQSLRLLGLNRKVLVFDEVHAADEYMFELLESLLALHLHQGGSVILLTATLSKKQRQKLVDIWSYHLSLGKQPIQNISFPLATKVSGGKIPLLESSLASRIDLSREVLVYTIHSFDECVSQVLSSVEKGQCVVWIRNTVNDALEAYQVLVDKLDRPDSCQLFHSRFILQDRKKIEEKVLNIFGKQSTSQQRSGKVLIATQVFQESLDADTDVMISDICPIDDLIQRAGRLHRHTRDEAGAYQSGIVDSRRQPILYVHAPKWSDSPDKDWLSREFQNTQYVYRSPGRLWLGLRELIKLGAIRMPSEARQLIEAVYGEDAYENIPKSLEKQEQEMLGEQRSKAAKAHAGVLNWKKYGYSSNSAAGWYEDETGISTRYSDIETAEVVLMKENSQGEFTLWVDEQFFALQLSTVKLGVNKYINKLNLLNPEDARLSHLKTNHKELRYSKIWFPEEDNHFGYSSDQGFYEREANK